MFPETISPPNGKTTRASVVFHPFGGEVSVEHESSLLPSSPFSPTNVVRESERGEEGRRKGRRERENSGCPTGNVSQNPPLFSFLSSSPRAREEETERRRDRRSNEVRGH